MQEIDRKMSLHMYKWSAMKECQKKLYIFNRIYIPQLCKSIWEAVQYYMTLFTQSKHLKGHLGYFQRS